MSDIKEALIINHPASGQEIITSVVDPLDRKLGSHPNYDGVPSIETLRNYFDHCYASYNAVYCETNYFYEIKGIKRRVYEIRKNHKIIARACVWQEPNF